MKDQVLLSYTKGITRTPSDFLCGDGELAESINLSVKGEELVPMELPVDMGVTLGANEELIYVHSISQVDRKNFITKTTSGDTATIKAFYLEGTTKRYYTLSVNVKGYTSIASLGMTLVVYGEEGAHYILFKDLNYSYLGTELPDVSLSFNLTGAYRLEDEDYEIEESGDNNSPYSITGSTEVHQAHVNKFIAEKATGQGKFMYPFFVRYALRLYNGETYTRYSAPMLMLPSIYTSPSVHLLNTTLSGGLKSAKFVVGGYVADLQMKVNGLGDLENWGDIVKGVSIFITRQTYSYNQAYSDSDNFLNESNQSEDGSIMSLACEHVGEITEADKLDGYTVIVNTLPKGYLKWNTRDVYSLLGSQTLAVPTIERNEFIGELMANTAAYYKYLDLDTEQLVSGFDNYVTLSSKYDTHSLETIEQSEALDTMGDYMTNDILVPSFVNTYNSRLNIANVKRILYKGYAPDSLSQIVSGNSQYDIYTYIHASDGKDIVVKSESIGSGNLYGSFMYYPDTDAYKMVIVNKTNNTYATVNLTEDMYSNGAYAINLDGLEFESGSVSVSTTANYELMPNKLFTSAVNNPFYFPLAGINTVGTGRILGISALTRPISQGQFGEFPLMAFCTDGNFALKVSSDGYYSGISPMQEDVILGQDKLTSLENSILAITKKGIMIAGGSSDMTQIALQMDGKNFSTSSLSGLIENASGFSNLISKADDIEGFREYLEGARMAYDYSSDRVIIYNKNKSYGYVYLFENNTVGKLVLNGGDKIITHVVSYPDSIIQTASGKLYSLYQKEDVNELTSRRLGFALTRPLTFGSPLGLKSIRQLKNMWAKAVQESSIKCKIYGSNDNVTYVPIQSKYGKPYKYYRLAFFTDILPKEAFSGTALIIENRRTNKLR